MYLSLTKFKPGLNIRICSWAKKTLWRQKKLKLCISSAEEEREEHSQGAEEDTARFCWRGSVMPGTCCWSKAAGPQCRAV